MSPEASKKLVLVSVALMGGTAVVKDLTGKGAQGSTFRRLWALGAVGLVLSVLADFAPSIAGPFAALLGIGYLAGAEGAITSFVSGAVGTPGAAAGNTKVSAAASAHQHGGA